MYNLLKSLLFLLSPEMAHEFAMKSLSILLRIPLVGTVVRKSFQPVNPKPVVVKGITFPNTVGLAAGFDKNAKWLHLLKDLGFGHVEVGTVTPLAQPGNPKPLAQFLSYARAGVADVPQILLTLYLGF